MNDNNANAFLEREKLGVLMRRYAVPCVISLLVATLYNIVDQIFIANADYLGSYGNAANTVVFPLTVIALAIAVMIGDGCCSFVSICLGARDREHAHRSIGNAVVLSVVCAAVLTLLYLILCDPILTAFGGRVNEETFRYSQEYFFYITLGIPFYMFGQAMNPIIRSDGSPKFAMASTLAGAAVNVVLDPVFIFGFRWGMMGAAAATVLGQVLTAPPDAFPLWATTSARGGRTGPEGCSAACSPPRPAWGRWRWSLPRGCRASSLPSLAPPMRAPTIPTSPSGPSGSICA